jgi:hypothetical protein
VPFIWICIKIQLFERGAAAVPMPRADGKKESRAKALLQFAHKVPVDSRFVIIWSGRDLSRRRFSSHRLGPQPPERNIIAQTRSIQRISYSYLIAVQFVTMVVVHCTINDQGLARRGFWPVSRGEPIESIAVLVIGGVIRFHCVRRSRPRIMRGAHATFSFFSADPA